MSDTHIAKTRVNAAKPMPQKAPKVTHKKASRSRKTPSGAASSSDSPISQARHHMIAEAAYYLAERRGFANGDPVEDWLEAEDQIDHLLTANEEFDDSLLIAGIDHENRSEP